jgi:hypothetical protein
MHALESLRLTFEGGLRLWFHDLPYLHGEHFAMNWVGDGEPETFIGATLLGGALRPGEQRTDPHGVEEVQLLVLETDRGSFVVEIVRRPQRFGCMLEGEG